MTSQKVKNKKLNITIRFLEKRRTVMYQQAKIKFQLILNLALVSVAIINSRCASITGSKNQPVSINTICEVMSIAETSCTLINDRDTWYVNTSGSVMVQKSYSDLAVGRRKGDAFSSDKFQSKNDGSVWGDLIAGGIIGYAADAESGAAFAIDRI